VALKQILMIGLTVMTVASCGREAAQAPPPAEGPDPLSVTRWTERTELFAEYPSLVVGQTSRFAIHLTTLNPFKAVLEGGVEVQLKDSAGQTQSFSADAPSRPGIFGVDVKPARAGKFDLIITLRGKTITDTHNVGAVDVYNDAAAATAAAAAMPESQTETFSFLKEQQWVLDFGTAVVQQQALRATIRVPGEIVPAPGGEADVSAPFDGRLASVVSHPPGTSVTAGQELARIQPPPGAPADLPQLERGRTQTASALESATRDRERAERLVTAGAAPQRRLDEARAAEAQAAAAVKAAEAQLGQFNASRSATGGGTAGLFVIRAPISGVIVARSAAAGMNVSAGTSLFHLVNPTSIQVVGHIPEGQVTRAKSVSGAQIELPGAESMQPAGKLVSLGRVLDPQSRTLPISFATGNGTLGAPVGQSVFLHLLLEQTAPAPVVPSSAIVDDAGRPIVFVQVEGEAFERRPVTLGVREGERVQVLAGVKPGEHIVTKGAYLVRLASLSTSVPAHGHVH
jgi:cobalt-zinc-cadmium efflux system membrane fusion protein